MASILISIGASPISDPGRLRSGVDGDGDRCGWCCADCVGCFQLRHDIQPSNRGSVHFRCLVSGFGSAALVSGFSV
eukprot:117337-Rhodomonas_salina.2